MKIHSMQPGSESTIYQRFISSLFIKLCLAVWRDPYGAKVWRRKGDNEFYFYLGIGIEPGEQMRLEIPIEFWDQTEFAKEISELPEYDGHAEQQIIERLAKYLRI